MAAAAAQFLEMHRLWWIKECFCWKIFSNLASELMARVQQKDLVQGLWHLDSNRVVTVETDASSVGIGGVLEVDGLVIENASWLRKEVEHSHINVAKLEAVGKVNLAIDWELKPLH